MVSESSKSRGATPAQNPREGHRILRHLCIAGLCGAALIAVKGILPDVFGRFLFRDQALGIEVGWLLPCLGAGLLLSWFLRRRRLLLWRRALGLAAAVQASYFGWLAVQGYEPAIPAVCGAWAGVILVQSFCATSQQTYNLLQWISLILLLAGGWRQTTDLYPELLAVSLVLLIYSCLAARASPVGVAKKYVDSRYPGLEHTIGRGAFLLFTMGLASWPIYLYLPRPTPEQRDFLRAFVTYHSPALVPTKKLEPLSAEDRALPRTGPQHMRLNAIEPPKHTGETLLVVQGRYNVPWRAAVLDSYNGRTWKLRPTRTITPIRTADPQGENRALLSRRDGSAMLFTKSKEFQVHVLGRVGRTLVRPTGTVEVAVPGRRLFRDGLGNIYITPPLTPPSSYVVKAPPVVDRRKPHADKDPAYVRLPAIPARVHALAKELSAGCRTDRECISAFMTHLRQRCRYELKPHRVPYDQEATDHFLFEQPAGWCVHFASSLAVLCRLRGIPARVVVGFGAGKRDPLTGSIRITDMDAHAWIEARPDGGAWEEFDPTPAADSPLQRPQKQEAETQEHLGKITERLMATGTELREGYECIEGEVRERPQWLLLFLPLLGGGMWLVQRWRTRKHRARIRQLWQELRDGTPRVAARAAYVLAADHLERAGYGDRRHTPPMEYLQRLREEGHVAAPALAHLIATYDASAFGPQVSLRWDRLKLARSCEEVLARVRARTWLRRQRQNPHLEVIQGEPIAPQE